MTKLIIAGITIIVLIKTIEIINTPLFFITLPFS